MKAKYTLITDTAAIFRRTNRFIIVFCFLSDISFAQIIDQSQDYYCDKEYSDKAAHSEQLIIDLMKEKQIPGLSIVVANKEAILWAQGFGYAELENKSPVKINTKFRIGSISKSLTAVALGKLIENGQIELEDNILLYVNYFPEKKYPITINQLASHTSGIRDYDYKGGEYLSSENYTSIESSTGIFKDDSLLFEPGTKYSYSTYGYVLLSAVIEGATGSSFLDYMYDSVFIPLNMRNTVPDFNFTIIPNRARFYDESNGEIVNGYYINNSNKWAGGGYLSTPYDLALMSQNLLNHQFVNELTVSRLWSSDTLLNGETVNYGIGWKLDRDSLNRNYVYHGGSSVGGRSFLQIFPQEELIIAITCNLSTNFDQKFMLSIANIFFKKD